MLGALVVLLAAAGVIALIVIPPWFSDYVKRQFIERTNASFDGVVSVDSMSVALFPHVQVTGRNLVVRRHGYEDQPPLITIDHFGAETSITAVMQGRVRRLTIEGMAINIPPDRDDDKSDADANAPNPSVPQTSSGTGAGGPTEKLKGLTIAEILCTNALLTIAPDEPDGTPQLFDIKRVRLEHFAVDRPAAYDADLINPRPRGPVASRGEFGPWNRRTPRLTPLSGTYTMTAADMSVFKGIAGALTSSGQFGGVLESIDVKGTSTMSDFTVDVGGHPMRLDTSFDARVDGTNGNTYLDRVDAILGESRFTAKGQVAGTPGQDGKRITLEVNAEAARLEDFIYLVVNEEQPPLGGAIALHTFLDLPPGDIPVPERIQLDGTFTIREGRFANPAVQQRIDELSRRGQGKPTATEIDGVASTFSGKYVLRNGVLSLPHLQFHIRGAEVRVGGRYTLRGAGLDFTGHLRLDAPLSRTTTGYKSWLLRLIDPFFRKNGAGAEIPIKLGGTAHAPKFGLNFKGL
jgi:hypothetical protein